MAMTMNGEVQLAAPREMVWTKLNDPAVLKACIPGCEELEKTEDNGFRAVAKMKVGPVSARFRGRVTLSDLDPPNGYRISGEGEGGVAGFAKGGARVLFKGQLLEPDPIAFRQGPHAFHHRCHDLGGRSGLDVQLDFAGFDHRRDSQKIGDMDWEIRKRTPRAAHISSREIFRKQEITDAQLIVKRACKSSAD